MKTREGNTYTDVFIPVADDIKELRKHIREVHRMFHPRKPKEEPSDATMAYRTLRNSIRRGRHLANEQNLAHLLYVLEFVFSIKVPILDMPKPEHKQRIHPKHLYKKEVRKERRKLSCLKPQIPSVFEMNRWNLIKWGWEPKQSHSKRQRVRRVEMRVWVKSRRGTNNEFTVKERRMMRNKEVRRERESKYIA